METNKCSIPSRWEAVILTRTPLEKKGFGSQACRFVGDLNSYPGPGTYAENSDLLFKNPSLSKKGYGNAFLSHSKKQLDPVMSDAPGPGIYTIRGVGDDSATSNKASRAFAGNDVGRVPYPKPPETPGPYDYRCVSPSEYIPSSIRVKSWSSFESCTKRDSFLVNNETTGVSASYDVVNLKNEVRTSKWSKSDSKRFKHLIISNNVPGPGAYFDEKSENDEANNRRTCGRMKGIQFIGKQNDKPCSAIHTFGNSKNRYEFMGRLDLKAEIPGPGSYTPDNTVLGITMSPERASRDHRSKSSPKGPLDRPKTSTFGSSKRGFDSGKVGIPGPAYYNPRSLQYKVPIQNLDGRWL